MRNILGQENTIQFNRWGVRSSTLHFIGFIITGWFLIAFCVHNEIWLLIVFLSCLLVIVLSFIYSFHSWNYKIYVDTNGFWYMKNKEEHEFKWEEIDSVKEHTNFNRFYTVTICYRGMTKKMTFDYNKYKMKKILEICPISHKKMFEDLLSKM